MGLHTKSSGLKTDLELDFDFYLGVASEQLQRANRNRKPETGQERPEIAHCKVLNDDHEALQGIPDNERWLRSTA